MREREGGEQQRSKILGCCTNLGKFEVKLSNVHKTSSDIRVVSWSSLLYNALHAAVVLFRNLVFALVTGKKQEN